MTRGEGEEGFARLAASEITLEHFFESCFQFAARDAVKNLPADRLVFAETASDEDVVPFNRFARDFYFGSEQSNVAHIMLRAGVRAPCEMNIQRMIELEA